MPAIKGQSYTDYITLPSRTLAYGMQVNPTIVAGDVKVVKDGGAAANITTLPSVSGAVVTYTLSSTETNANSIIVLFKDQSADEWADITVKIDTGTSPSATADAVWDEAYNTHTSAGTFGKLMDILRKSNLQIDGLVNDAAATTTSFKSNLTHVTGAHDHQILLFVTGALEGESRPILSYNNTNGLITLQEPLTAAPANGSEFVILIQHVHPVEEIAEAVRAELATELGRVDIAVSSRLASGSYVAPSNSDISAIKAKTDNLTFTQSGIVDANIQYVNDVQVKGTGTESNPWSPV